MLKFQNQNINYDVLSSPHQNHPYKVQQNQRYQMQDTFGKGQLPTQQPTLYQQALQMQQQMQQLQKQPQQQYQQQQQPQSQQQQQQQLQQHQQQQQQQQNQQQTQYPQRPPKKEQDRQISTYQPRMPSADTNVLQNRSNIPMQTAPPKQYMSNPRQATPMKPSEGKQIKQVADQSMMYSPMPKSQLLNETTNLAKLQQQQVLQNRSPQIQKVAGASNASQIVEELHREKEKNQQLTLKLKKLETDKKMYNTTFLNEMELKIKSLIQQNDQLQSLNMELLQKAQNQPTTEIDDLQKQIVYNTQQVEFLNRQIQESKNALQDQRAKYSQLEEIGRQQAEQEEQQITILVQDLEDKVQSLITENERLNEAIVNQEPKKEQISQINAEKAKVQQAILVTNKEVNNLKLKLETAQKKSQGKETIEQLEDQIRTLIEENDYLNNVVQQQIERENQIAQLEEEMQNLVEQNDNLEMLVQQKS